MCCTADGLHTLTHHPSLPPTAHAQVRMPITDRFIIACILINTIIMMFKISPRPDRLGEAGWPVNLANKDNDYMDRLS